jgi:UDP-N-acetylmuramate--alanine ligase
LNLNDVHKIYFIGVGGIGMSALARYFNGLGCEVHGYDKTETVLTKKLAQEGIIIHYQDDLKYIPQQVDLVIYTPAVPGDHRELNYFKTNGFLVKKRAEILGLISRDQQTIGIAGTHGKTTTSSILTHILKVGGIDCTAFLGGIAQNFQSNFVAGKSNWVVIEADEYDRSFLHLTPDYAIILSMDADHLDIYENEDYMHEGFTQFAEKIKSGGKVFLRSGLELKRNEVSIDSFGVEAGIYRSKNLRIENGYFVFDIESPVENIENIVFTLPGRHNVENATAAISVAQQLGVKGEAIIKALASFKGIKRRFEIIYRDEHVVYIDDYAHHPTELKAAIDAARTLFPKRKITGIFQPHLYSRTRDFVDGFAEALDQLDEIILMDIYPARELPIEGVTSGIIFNKMKNPNKKMVTKFTLMDHLKELDFDVLLTLGAGDIDTFVKPIKTLIIND